MLKIVVAGLAIGAIALGVIVLSAVTAEDQVSAESCTATPGVLPGVVPSPYNNIFTAASAQWKIDPVLETAIFMSEHGNTWPDPNSVQASSPVGAMGWFQFMPGTWAAYSNSNPNNPSGDPQNLTDAAYAAAHYLSVLGGKLDMQPGDPDNPQPGTVARVAGGYNNMDHAYMVNAVQQFLKFKQAAPATTTTGAQAAAPSDSVYVLGDSIALGARSQLIAALGGSNVYVNASKDRSINVAGITPGFQTSGLVALQEDANKQVGDFQGASKATTIIIELGTNDRRGGPAFESRIRALIGRIRGTGKHKAINPTAKLYWVEVFSKGSVDRRSLNNSIESLAGSENYTPIETIGQGIDVEPDGVHPTAAGNDALAKVIAAKLNGLVSTDLANGNPVISGTNPGCPSAGNIVMSPNGYTSPFPVTPTITRAIDQGVDYNVPAGTPLKVIGNAQVMGVDPSWYNGQPYIWYKLLDGSLKDKCIYYAEQITGKVGTNAYDPVADISLQDEISPQPLPAGTTIAYFASGGSNGGTNLEFGFADCASGTTLAKTTGTYKENMSTAAGVSFNKLMVSLGVPSDSPYPQILGSVAGMGYP
jgi:lysophospholipase L1-like esterase